MSQLIDFENFNPEKARNIKNSCSSSNNSRTSSETSNDEKIALTLQILTQNNSGKIIYTLKEAAAQLNIGEELVRRRIKNNNIKVTYFGDKPMIHIIELARISVEGV